MSFKMIKNGSADCAGYSVASFYHYFDTMTEKQKKQLDRRQDENGREICGEYIDFKTMSILPSYCT
jgi:hypothetical protein